VAVNCDDVTRWRDQTNITVGRVLGLPADSSQYIKFNFCVHCCRVTLAVVAGQDTPSRNSHSKRTALRVNTCPGRHALFNAADLTRRLNYTPVLFSFKCHFSFSFSFTLTFSFSLSF